MFGLKGSRKDTSLRGLDKTRTSLLLRIGRAISGKSRIDSEVLDRLEEVMIESDIGVQTTIDLIGRLEKLANEEKYSSTSEINNLLVKAVTELLSGTSDQSIKRPEPGQMTKPHVIMVVGVNGVGKTTTIGKLAYRYTKEGKKVILGAADTFRAAAVDQLKVWAERASVPLIYRNMGSDPAAVAFETVSQAVKTGAEYAIIDTAGRLHNKINLMNELSKVRKVMEKVVTGAPHEVMLVLDASTGQNAIEQARQFIQAVDVNSIALTKLDGTAKGGVVIAVSHQFGLPVKFIGTGEGPDDLQPFDPEEFARGIFGSGA